MRHVIITGGSSGIGEAFAAWYLDRGDHVTLIARSEAGLESAKERLAAGDAARAARIALASADVAERERLAAAIDAGEALFGPCDVLVTSAGTVMPGYFDALDDDAFRRQMEVNYFGTLHAIRAVYPAMKRRRAGRLILLSSGAGLYGVFGYTAYGASKFALSGFAEALRFEARPHGITVSICFPPDTETPQLTEERRHQPAETAAITAKGGLWKAKDIAEQAARASERGRFAIYPGHQMLALGLFGGLGKPLLNAWFDRLIRRSAR